MARLANATSIWKGLPDAHPMLSATCADRNAWPMKAHIEPKPTDTTKNESKNVLIIIKIVKDSFFILFLIKAIIATNIVRIIRDTTKSIKWPPCCSILNYKPHLLLSVMICITVRISKNLA